MDFGFVSCDDPETKPFVEKLFEALHNKEYLTSKTSSESKQSSSKSESGADKGNSDTSPSISVKGDKSSASLTTESEPTSSSSSGPTASVSNSTNQPNVPAAAAQTKSPENEGSPSKKGSITLSVTPSALLNSEGNNHPSQSAAATDSGGVVSGSRDDSRGKRDRRDVRSNPTLKVSRFVDCNL